MSWTLHKAATAFESHQTRWDELNRMTGGNVLLDSRFVALLLRYFGTDRTFLAVDEGPGGSGMALVECRRPGFWQTFQPSQAPLGLIVLADSERAKDQMRRLIRTLPGFALEFAVLQQDSASSVFRGVPESAAVCVQKHIETAWIPVRGNFQDYWKSRRRDLVDNLARRTRRLERDGIGWEFRMVRDPDGVAAAIQEYGRLESSGWKAGEGTAVSAENEQGMFYRDVLHSACQRGEGIIYQILFEGRAVASQLGLARNGMLVLVKMAYDEEYRSHSPGYLLQYKILESAFEGHEIQAVEFYGKVNPGWTDKWADEVRPIFHITFQRYGWVRWALDSIKRMTGAKRGAPSAVPS